MNDEHFMALALIEAKKAGQNGEVPIGALVVAENGDIITAAYNRTIELNDPTAHAEILAIRDAAARIGNYRLTGFSLYVTIEPCIMCMGAIIHSRFSRVIFGAHDPKWGAAGSLYDLSSDNRLNHQVEIISGVKEENARILIQEFFRNKRNK
ncbi:MAG: tRNA adenosine(34) deaminase TadA [Proteobacteria bacterium]|nr:tRNA adenosine(34) deaminase TadA [Pseudomonadota bacterium]